MLNRPATLGPGGAGAIVDHSSSHTNHIRDSNLTKSRSQLGASTLKRQISLQQTSADTYTATWHVNWTLGTTLHGGSVAAMIHHAAVTHLVSDPALAARNQPDVLSLHIEFLRPCNRCDSIITVANLKLGATSSTIQLQLSQTNQLRVVALANSTNFDKPVGPTQVLPTQPEKHWLPAHVSGEILNVTSNLIVLNPRGGFPVDGVCDGWYGYREDAGDQMDAPYLTMMSDLIPSMSDTLLQDHPGVPLEVVNTASQALQASVYNNTVMLDIEFKRRLPDGLRWVFTRVNTKMLREGRMDVDITMCDENMELLCSARQLILVLEAQRKFRTKSPKPAL
ncbi:thioesterase family protein [Astrocystis sublimbata]|nr:thioesterase family protein [Astrocystis sublimbata]